MARCEERDELEIFLFNTDDAVEDIFYNSIVLCKKCSSLFPHKMPNPSVLNLLTKSMILINADNRCQCEGWCGRH